MFKENMLKLLDHKYIHRNLMYLDISNLELENGEIDIAILCLAMWVSNCHDYIKEANRILDHNGILLIIEPKKRWMNEEENKLENLILGNKFLLKKYHSKDKFMFGEFVKN